MKTKKLVIIGVFILLGLVIFVYRPSLKTYPLPTPKEGFILGAKTKYSFVFPFYEHPKEGLAPLSPLETLYSNKLILFCLAYQDRSSEIIRIRMFQQKEVETENGTQVVIRNEEEFSYTLSMTQFKIVENELELSTHYETYKIELYLKDDNRIFVFYHLTHPSYLPAERYTLGSLQSDRMVYLFTVVLFALFCIGLSKITVDRRKIIPQIRIGTALWLSSIFILILLFAGEFLIYYYGLMSVWWTYLPLGIISYVFGFAILRPSTIMLYFMKTIEAHVPTKEMDSLMVVKKENDFYNANISWKDFMAGKEEKIDFEEEYYWYWRIKNSDDRVYIYKSITRGDIIKVELAGVHFKDVDEFLSELIKVTNISEQKEIFRKELLELIAKFEVVVDRRALQLTKKYMELMMMEEETIEEKKESKEKSK